MNACVHVYVCVFEGEGKLVVCVCVCVFHTVMVEGWPIEAGQWCREAACALFINVPPL